MGDIVPNADMTIIGEAPGINEVDQKRPFVGWSGDILNHSLSEAGIRRDRCTITNTILCQPPDGGNYVAYTQGLIQKWKRKVRRCAKRGENPPLPPVLPAQACGPRLVRDIAESNARVVTAVGKQALEASAIHLNLAHGAAHVSPGEPYVSSIRKQHGAPVFVPDGRVLMSSYHPAMTRRGRKEYFPVVRENLTRAAKVARSGGAIDWTEPAFNLNPTVDEVVDFCQRLLATGAEVTCDLETDSIDVFTTKIRCVGIGANLGPGGLEEKVMVIPFRHMDGTDWWTNPADKMRAALAMHKVFDSNPLAGQNFQFDTSVMLERGLMTDRHKSWSDTMLLHHNTPDNDLPHDLGFIARRYFCFPMWKADIDHKSVNNVDDQNLHLYNARDVLITMRLLEPLRQDIQRYGTQPQNDTDYKLAPNLREMGNLGLVVDEERRGQFSEVLNWHCQRELWQFREAIGRHDFNPRSVPKLQELIFNDWGYVPVIGTDGYEIKKPTGDTWQSQMLREDDEDLEDEIGSTSSAALIELMKKREMKPEHVHAIKVLLEYRAYDKLRGTYVDNLKVRQVDWSSFGYDVPIIDAVSAFVWDRKVDGYFQKELLGRRSALSLLNTVYKGHVIPTGRLSTQPAVQNWPALGKMNMREMVVCPPGHLLVGADYAQLEARLYAVAAQDELLLQAIRDGRDIHSMNAAALLARNLGELDYWYNRVEHGEGLQPSERKKYRKYWRTVAKRFAFLEIYGGEEDKLFSVMAQQRDKVTGELSFPDLKKSDVELWHNNWHTLHPWTHWWHQRCAQFCDDYGYAQVADIDFRKRFFLGGISKKNAVPNMSIQGWAASIANRALLQLIDALPFRSLSPWTGACLQVHDYIGCYVPEAHAERMAKVLEECMYYEYMGVPFPAEAGISSRWSGQD
jgi:DNA polymerase I-like protein with 3'-5' exonuclease and polymerase domains/uracil-DNA glycosylase